MKKQLILPAILFLAISASSQSSYTKPSAKINIKSLTVYKYSAQEGVPSSLKPTATILQQPAVKQVSKTSSTNTWQNFTASMNIYGVSNSYVKPLQWNDDLDAVSFLHRKSPTYTVSPPVNVNAENGSIVAMISTDCGAHWDSTAIWSNNTFWGRFPGGAIYNPPSTTPNTNIDNCYIVGTGATTGSGATNFTASWYASKKIGAGMYSNVPSTVTNAQQVAPTVGPQLPNVARHDFAAYNFTATDDGKMRVLAGIANDNLSPVSDTALMLVTGSFNNGVFDWVGPTFYIPVTKASDGSHNFLSRPMMAWNEMGTVGYIVVMGARIGSTGANAGNQPIVYKTTNSGATWSLESMVDFNLPAFANVLKPLQGVDFDSTLKVPNFFYGEGMDCAVDAEGKLHVFTTIIGHPSNHRDSLNFINQFTSEKYLWPHTPGRVPYLYDFIYNGLNTLPNWTHVLVDSMATEGPGAASTSAGYDDNPWDKDPSTANRKFSIDARLQMSRTPDGKHLLYTWAESDLAFTQGQRHWNTMPNIKARGFNVIAHDDVLPNSVSVNKIDVTDNAIGEVASRAMCHFASPKFKLVSVGSNTISVSIPMTLSNSNPYSQLGANTHWFSCASMEFSFPTTVGISENTKSATQSYLYPNPTKSYANLAITLSKNARVEITVVNVVGQVVKTQVTEGQPGENTITVGLSDLVSGVYFVNVKIGTISSTKKLIIE